MGTPNNNLIQKLNTYIKYYSREIIFNIGYVVGSIKPYKFLFNNIFMFHSYDIGGAEIVHLRIVQAIEKECLMIFLGNCENDSLLAEYKKLGIVWDLTKCSKLEYFFLLGWISTSLNKSKNKLTILGVSIYPFYKILQGIKNNKHEILDIIHAYSAISICPPKLISLFKHRIVIDEKTLSDLEVHYSLNNKTFFFNRIKLIYNYTELNGNVSKNENIKLKVIYVGRESYEKRIHLIKAIASRCLSEKLLIEFCLIGLNKENTPAYSSIGVVEDQDKLEEIYNNSDILLITSIREGFPMVIIEAMKYGIIPIATSVGGIPFHITNGVNGFLVDAKMEEGIIEQFIQILRHLVKEKQLKMEMSINSRNYSKKTFCRIDFFNQWKEILL